MPQTALLLIDIQNDYFPSFEGARMALPAMDGAAGQAASLLSAARASGTEIIHVKHVMPSDEAPFFKPGSPGAEIHESVVPLASETLIEKPRPNSFAGTDLENHLRSKEITNLVICGAMSQMCIDATTRAAADLGFNVTLADDACAAADVSHNGTAVTADLVHAAIMAPLATTYARVLHTSECLPLFGR